MDSHYLRIPSEDPSGEPDDFNPDADIVRLCPTCKKSRFVKRDDVDPPQTRRIEMPCIRCSEGSEPPRYFDADGNQIPFP